MGNVDEGNTHEVVERAVLFTDDRIKVAVAIEIREGGAAVSPDINTIEGVSRARLLGVDWVGGTTRVLVVFESAVLFTDDRIKVAVAIEIREGGAAERPAP